MEPKTKLVEKEASPLIIRRYSYPILHFVSLITDDNLSDLDRVVEQFWEENEIINDIQGLRNLAGRLSQTLINKYKKVEGVAIILVADKCVVSSLWGDFMHHLQCRLELYTLLNFMTNI